MAKKGKKRKNGKTGETAIAAAEATAKSNKRQKMPKKLIGKNGRPTTSGKQLVTDFTNAILVSGFMLATAFFNVVSTYEGINVPDEDTQKDELIMSLYNASYKGSEILYKLWQVYRFSLNKEDLEMKYKEALRTGKKIKFDEMTGGDKLLYIKLMIEPGIVTKPSKEPSKERKKKKRKTSTGNDDNNNNNNSSSNAPIGMNLEARPPKSKKLRKPKVFGKLSKAGEKLTTFDNALNGIKTLGVQSVINSMYIASFLFPGLNYGIFSTDTGEVINDGQSTIIHKVEEDPLTSAKHAVRSSTFFEVDKGTVTGGTGKPTLKFKKEGKLSTELGDFTIRDDSDYNKVMQFTVFNSDENTVMFNLFYIMVNVLMKYCVEEELNSVMPLNLQFNSDKAIRLFNQGLQNLMENIKMIGPNMNLTDVLKDVFRLDILPSCLGAGNNSMRAENMSDFWKFTKMGTSNGLDGSMFYSIWSLFRMNKMGYYNHKEPKESTLEQLQHFFFNDVFVLFVGNLRKAVDIEDFIPKVDTLFEIFIKSFNTVRDDYVKKGADEQEKTKKNTTAGSIRTKSVERVNKNRKGWMGIVMDFCRLQLFKTLCDVVQFDSVAHPNNTSKEVHAAGSKRSVNKQTQWWHQSGISRAEMVDVTNGNPTMLYGHEAKRWHMGFKLDKQLCPKVESLYGDDKVGLFAGFSSFFSKEAMNGNTSRMSVNFLWKALIHKLYFTRVYLSKRETVKAKTITVNGKVTKQPKGCYGFPKFLFTKNPDNNNNGLGGYVCDRKGQIEFPKVKKMVIEGEVQSLPLSMSSWYLGEMRQCEATEEWKKAVKNKTLKGKEKNEARKKLMAFEILPDRIQYAIGTLKTFREGVLKSMERPKATKSGGLSDATVRLVGHTANMPRVLGSDMMEHLRGSSELVRKNGIWMKPVSMMSMIIQLIILAMTVLDMDVGPEEYDILYPNNAAVSKYGKDHTWHLPDEKHIIKLCRLMVRVFVIKAPYTAALFAPFETLKQLFKSHLGFNIEPYKATTTTTNTPNADTKAHRRYYINAMMDKLRDLFSEAVKMHNNSNGGRVKAPRLVIKPTTIHEHLLKHNAEVVDDTDLQVYLQTLWGNVNKKAIMDYKQMEKEAAKENAVLEEEGMFDIDDLDFDESDDSDDEDL